MLQFIILTNMLRELDERSLINHYARLTYLDDSDVVDEVKIKNNLEKLLNWDINGDKGLALYCGKFENLSRKDWIQLTEFIKFHGKEIKEIASRFSKQKKLDNIKEVLDWLDLKEQHNIKVFSDPDYKVTKRGKPAKTCIYKGKEYKSRQECMYKEGITKAELYKYLCNQYLLLFLLLYN